MRGVHQSDHGERNQHRGSSPHARGPLSRVSRAFVSSRIIPACAGSTNHNGEVVWAYRDHPRMRGVHHKQLEANHAG